MKKFRILLFPFAILYDAVTSVRNFFYDKGIFQSTGFSIPIIAIGNLSVGGTGKTPMVEYLIRLLNENYKIVTLSRGYKRKSKGFFMANSSTVMDDIGDEPFQYFSKFKNIHVAVDANRVEGVQKILKLQPETEVVILDDAFQHRKIKAGFYIVLTSYDELYFNDFLLPAGNLRENSRGIDRANVVVVTKCPEEISLDEMNRIASKIKKSNDSIFFTTISYENHVSNSNSILDLNNLENDFLAVAGIAKPQFFYNFLNRSEKDTLTFPDHHNFSANDIKYILEKANGRKIVTTEKDYMRLQHVLPQNILYYLPIKTKFVKNHRNFDELVVNFLKSK